MSIYGITLLDRYNVIAVLLRSSVPHDLPFRADLMRLDNRDLQQKQYLILTKR
jgi:hypothetical protein